MENDISRAGRQFGSDSPAARLVLFSSTKDRQRQQSPSEEQADVALTGLTLREGLTSANFYLLGAAGMVMSLASVALTINIVPILVDKGLTLETAAVVAGVIGISQIIGRLAGGYLLDRFNARFVAAVSVALPTVTCTILLATYGSWPAAVVAVAFLGFAAGAEMDAVAYLSSRCFGMLNFAALFGAFMGLITLGFGLAPVLANYIYDRAGSYDPVLWAIMPLAVLSAVLFLRVGAYPDFDRKTVTVN